MPAQPAPVAPHADADDLLLVARIARHEPEAFERLMRRYNGRLFRVARAILRDDAEAEDALQDAYLDAYRHVADFHGNARLSTWLTRIVINRARMRLRSSRHRDRVVVPIHASRPGDRLPQEIDVTDHTRESPSETLLRAEIRRLIERRIDDLPAAFRAVFVMREVEEMTVQETADCLSLPSATVRTRLFRARALLRAALARDLDVETLGVFRFDGARCDRIVARVLARVARRQPDAPRP